MFEAGIAASQHAAYNLPTIKGRTFAEFVGVLQAHSTSTEKGKMLICAPMSDGHRCMESAQPRAWLGVDIDNVTADQMVSYMRRATESGYEFAWYPTSSATDERPKRRLLVALSDKADRESIERLSEAWHRLVAPEGLQRDYTADRTEQPLFLPINGAQIQHVPGKPFETYMADVAGIPSSEVLRASRRSEKVKQLIERTGDANADGLDYLSPDMLLDFQGYGEMTIADAVRDVPDDTRCSVIPGTRVSGGSHSCIWHISEDGRPYVTDPADCVVYWPTAEWTAGFKVQAAGFGSDVPLPPGASLTPVSIQQSIQNPTQSLVQQGINPFTAGTRALTDPGSDTKQAGSLVYGLLGMQSLTALWGAPGAGKSFLVAELARSVATGEQYIGRNTRRGRVLYITTEGDVRKRFEAKGLVEGVDVMTCPVDLMAPAQVSMLIDHVKSQDYKLVIFDVFIECMSGDENDTADMRNAVAGLRALRDQTGAAVLVVHHSNKAGDAMRGSSVLKGALDNELTCRKAEEGDDRILAAGKMRDGRDYYELMHFELKPQDMGPDLDELAPEGTRRIAMYVEFKNPQDAAVERIERKHEAQANPKGQLKRSASHQVLSILRSVKDGKMSQDDLSARFIQQNPHLSKTQLRAQFNAALAELGECGYTAGYWEGPVGLVGLAPREMVARAGEDETPFAKMARELNQ